MGRDGGGLKGEGGAVLLRFFCVRVSREHKNSTCFQKLHHAGQASGADRFMRIWRPAHV